MTADELRRLAEVAGLNIHRTYSNWYVKDISKIKETAIMVDDWQPHLRIEQAMMVAEALKNKLDGHFMLWWFEDGMVEATFHGKPYKMPFVFKAESKSPAEAICRAALAAAKEG